MSKDIVLDDDLKAILKSLSKLKEPVGGKEIESATGLSSSKVSSKIKKLKDAGLVDSPVRCKYSITSEGKGKI
ncbi:MAG: ArsR family transcriptional regulator [Acidobacteria bacterium]|nr:ArsR family transcriptional regulator [Acidobacteriota bacterium]